jgi:hypothetical protein
MKRLTILVRNTHVSAAMIAGLLVLAASSTPPARAQDTGRVFALLAIDFDAHIAGLEDDERGMTAALASGFGSTRLLNLRILKGGEVSPRAVVDAIRGFPIGPNDTLLFYYSGHGATFEGRGHVLTMSHGNLLRSDLRAVVAQRRARLSVLLTDCCSSLVKPQKEPPMAGAQAPQARVSPILRCLLLQHQGVVDLTSSSLGEASWSRQGTGGLFTSALSSAMGSWDVDEFDTNKDGFATWTEVFDYVRHETQASYQAFKQDLLNQDASKLDSRMLAALQSQRDQVPQAFALGDPQRANAQREFFAPNIGIRFRLVPVGSAAGARLTQDPVPGSGAAALRLEPGDIIYNLDGLPIRDAVDVMNHHGRTDVSFINVRTGGAQADVMMLPAYTPLPPDVPQEIYAANLGMHYQLMPYEGDTFGARLSRTATGNTPAAVIQLELGDMIIRLDGQPIKKAEDVLAHIDQTTVDFINIRTGKVETRAVQLPGQAGQ